MTGFCDVNKQKQDKSSQTILHWYFRITINKSELKTTIFGSKNKNKNVQ